MSIQYDIDDYLKHLREGTIKTTIPSMDYYDNYIKDNPYYNKLEDSFDLAEVMEDNCNKLTEENTEISEFMQDVDTISLYNEEEQDDDEGEVSNRYIKALKYRYDNRKKYLDYKYFYRYEIYDRLNNLDLNDKFCILEIQILIDDLERNRDKCKSYNTWNIDDLIEDLKSLKDDFIIPLDSLDSYLDLAIKAKNMIIEKYFNFKEKKYKDTRNEQFKKREVREEEYLKLLNSYEYLSKKMSKRDIAKMLGVSPAAVTQFCKRRNIR